MKFEPKNRFVFLERSGDSAIIKMTTYALRVLRCAVSCLHAVAAEEPGPWQR